MNTPAPGQLVPLRRVQGAPDEMSDEALVAACAVGEPAALGALFDRHNRALFRFLSRIAPGNDLDDLVQTTFIEVWKSSGRYNKRGAARSWIFGVAANVARHHIRSEVRRRVAMQGLAETPTGPRALRDRPDNEAERNELVLQLSAALDELPHDLRVAFVLCDVEDIPGVEAARALGVRKGTLWRRLHEARKRLRARLESTAGGRRHDE